MQDKSTKMHDVQKVDLGGLAILQVVPRLDSGGVEQTTLDVAIAVVKAGGQSFVASSGGRLAHRLAATGSELVSLPVHTKNPFKIFLNIFRLAKIINTNNINIVHARSRAPAWSAYYAAQRCNVPFITTYHGIYNATSAWKNFYNSIMTKGARVIANSSYTSDLIASQYGLSTQNIITIPRGIDVGKFDPDAITMQRQKHILKSWGLDKDTRQLILLPGRFSRWKGQAVLIEAAGRLRSFGRRDFVCILAGDSRRNSNYVKELTQLVNRLKLNGIVKIVDHCSDMPAALAASTVIVSASTDPEAFGRVAAEAQAMAKPVVVTDHGAAQETVVNGKTGWRVAPGDPGALAQALDATLSMSSAARAEFGKSGRNWVLTHYSVEQMCDKTIDLYCAMCGGPLGQE